MNDASFGGPDSSCCVTVPNAVGMATDMLLVNKGAMRDTVVYMIEVTGWGAS